MKNKILKLRSEGKTYQQIAIELQISMSSVYYHLKHVKSNVTKDNAFAYFLNIPEKAFKKEVKELIQMYQDANEDPSDIDE